MLVHVGVASPALSAFGADWRIVVSFSKSPTLLTYGSAPGLTAAIFFVALVVMLVAAIVAAKAVDRLQVEPRMLKAQAADFNDRHLTVGARTCFSRTPARLELNVEWFLNRRKRRVCSFIVGGVALVALFLVYSLWAGGADGPHTPERNRVASLSLYAAADTAQSFVYARVVSSFLGAALASGSPSLAVANVSYAGNASSAAVESLLTGIVAAAQPSAPSSTVQPLVVGVAVAMDDGALRGAMLASCVESYVRSGGVHSDVSGGSDPTILLSVVDATTRGFLTYFTPTPGSSRRSDPVAFGGSEDPRAESWFTAATATAAAGTPVWERVGGRYTAAGVTLGTSVASRFVDASSGRVGVVLLQLSLAPLSASMVSSVSAFLGREDPVSVRVVVLCVC